MRTFKIYLLWLWLKTKISENMASVLPLALALALRHLHSSIFVYSSAVNGDVCVCRAKPRQVKWRCRAFHFFWQITWIFLYIWTVSDTLILLLLKQVHSCLQWSSPPHLQFVKRSFQAGVQSSWQREMTLERGKEEQWLMLVAGVRTECGFCQSVVFVHMYIPMCTYRHPWEFWHSSTN